MLHSFMSATEEPQRAPRWRTCCEQFSWFFHTLKLTLEELVDRQSSRQCPQISSKYLVRLVKAATEMPLISAESCTCTLLMKREMSLNLHDLKRSYRRGFFFRLATNQSLQLYLTSSHSSGCGLWKKSVIASHL